MRIDQSDYIQVKGLKVFSHVGVLPEEKAEGQYFYIDFCLYPGYSSATKSDCLAETINYAEVSYLIKDLAEKSKRDLIEALAGDLAEALLQAYPQIVALRLDIHKPNAPIEADFTDVVFSLERRRRYPVKLAIGSNMGKRQAYLDFAVERLSKHPKISHLRSSRYFISKAWGVENQADFLNAVLAFETELDPRELLELCQNIEAEAGRQRKEKWGPRVLDLDIIYYGNYFGNTEELTIPHPYRLERSFVHLPLFELDNPALATSDDLEIFEPVRAEEALVVVDCQFDFIEGSLACHKSKEALEAIVQYINQHPDIFVAYSLDWHSMQNESFKRNGGIWPDHCVQNTQGSALDPIFSEAITNPYQRPGAHNCFYKGTDDEVEEYSAFNAKRQDGFALNEVLPKNVMVSGIASEYCVRESALALNEAGFNTKVLAEAIAYVDEQDHLKNLQDLRERNLLLEKSAK